MSKFKTLIKTDDGFEYQEYDSKHIIAGDSVASDTLVYIDNNEEVEIHTLFETLDNLSKDKEYFIPDRLNTLTYDESLNRTCYKKVKYVMRHKADKQMYRVWINNTSYVDVTEDHSLIGYVNTQRRRKGGGILSEMKPSDIDSSLIYLKTLPDTEQVSKGYSQESYEFFGFFVGDGSIKKNYNKVKTNETWNGINISSGIDTDEFISNIIDPLVDQNMINKYRVLSNTYDMYINGNIGNIIYNNFVSTQGKSIPLWMENETKKNIAGFLRGYFSADGTVINRNNHSIIRLTSINYGLLKIVQNLLFKLSISSTIFKENNTNKYKNKDSNTYSHHLCIKNIQSFTDIIGFIFDRKNQKILPISNYAKSIDNYDFGLSTVYKIEKIDYDDYVYDIEVEDTHMFFANNILVHNTDSAYIDLSAVFDKNADPREVTKVADFIGTETNDSFSDFMQQAFNVPDSNKDIIQTDREVVSDKSLFLKKKMYQMHIVNDEGIIVDKNKAMGIATKRSDTPNVVKGLLNKIIIMLMDREPYEDIRDIVDEFEVNYKNMSMPEVGRPTTVKHLREDSTAGHIRAALFYNSLCGISDRKIKAGDKIRVIYIDDYRSRSIAIPVVADIFPDFLNGLQINWKRQWETVEKKVNIFLIPVGYDRKTRQATHTNQFFQF